MGSGLPATAFGMRKVLRGHAVSFGPAAEDIWHEEQAALIVDEGGRLTWRGAYAALPQEYRTWPVEDHGAKLLLPGFVDAHVYFPQYRMLAVPAKDLLEWLSRYTFPEEARYGDEAFAASSAQVFLQRLFSHGTTAAMAFCSVHRQCADALFAAAEEAGMAMVTGKTMMDRNATPDVQDTAEQGARDTTALYEKWHGKGRLRYAVSPRFAVTSTAEQLAISGELLQSCPGALMQTHISESAAEIALVAKLFPQAKDYTDVYDSHGLLTERSVFAHGIHLSEREAQRFSEAGSTVVHCPTSNAFLGSGIMRMPFLRDEKRPVALGLATDVGGGTSYSMLQTMAEAYKLQMLTGFKPSTRLLFHMATLGNAHRLKIDAEMGSLDVGKFADVIVVDPAATDVLASRQALSNSIDDVLFSVMMLGDERAIHATYVGGRKVFERSEHAA
jgi:guanine deaminase